ncbi:dehydrogenase [Aerococcus urinaehominis]|uniref:Dehydrogenase n=1 Tax=Aerococcus urinaehominis TaxID=128944 RepID=A0A0X8FLF6_9LACT|nr:SDR family oxidoreductase [Aerococcus urinaehominis]AMB99464.1 dehydrogenase [Aerococcus urinaehominis]
MSEKIVITGSSSGIGAACVAYFLAKGHSQIYGLDTNPQPPVTDNPNYTHISCDISQATQLPDLDQVSVLINNAGQQTPSEKYRGGDLATNLVGTILCTEKYGLQPSIKAIVNLASVSAHNGAEFGEYTASKGGVLAYTKWTAKEIAQYGAVCNSLSFGGVITELNQPVMDDTDLWAQIMAETPPKKWVTAEEAAQWVYFMAIINRSCTAQDIIVDNGEFYNHNFIWEND